MTDLKDNENRETSTIWPSQVDWRACLFEELAKRADDHEQLEQERASARAVRQERAFLVEVVLLLLSCIGLFGFIIFWMRKPEEQEVSSRLLLTLLLFASGAYPLKKYFTLGRWLPAFGNWQGRFIAMLASVIIGGVLIFLRWLWGAALDTVWDYAVIVGVVVIAAIRVLADNMNSAQRDRVGLSAKQAYSAIYGPRRRAQRSLSRFLRRSSSIAQSERPERIPKGTGKVSKSTMKPSDGDIVIALRQVSVDYSARRSMPVVHALSDISVTFPQRSVTAVIGPSGCGKTTLLNVVAGLLLPSRGSVDWPNGLPMWRTGYVFQTPSLVPWLTVRQNTLFGAGIAGLDASSVEGRLASLVEAYGLAAFEDVYPSALSGGMQQRVSIIRAVLSGAKVLLLDEPFSDSDFLVRQELEREVSRLVDDEQLIAVLVTHDVESAARVADKVVVLTHRPARIKTEIAIPIARSERLGGGPAPQRLITPYVERIWEALRSPDSPVGYNHGVDA